MEHSDCVNLEAGGCCVCRDGFRPLRDDNAYCEGEASSDSCVSSAVAVSAGVEMKSAFSGAWVTTLRFVPFRNSTK